MFDNIGSKIKILAQVICWVGIIITVIIGVFLMLEGFGILLIIIGPLFSWIGSFCLYGFGELIEKTAEIAENTRCGNTINSSNNYQKIKMSDNQTICPNCKTQHDSDYIKCPNCGYFYKE